MANWYGTARSNYVKIKDLQGLKDALKPFGDISISESSKDPKLVCLLVSDGDSGAWPSTIYDENDDEIEFSPEHDICPFMADGEILVMQEVGAEKMRYVTGYAQAYNAKGESVSIGLDDIYELAATKFGVDKQSISHCQY